MQNKLPEVINEEEFFKIIKATKSEKHKVAFSLAFFCGLRISEVLKLKPENIDLSRGMLFVKEGKGNKDRYVPIPKPLVKGLKHLPLTIGRRAIQLAITNISIKAIGRRIHFHTLRHAAATLYLSKGMNIRQVQQLLGHARLDTTMIYTHVSPDEMKKKMEDIWG